MALFDPRFRDLVRWDDIALDELKSILRMFAKKEADGITLTPMEDREKDRVSAILDSHGDNIYPKDNVDPMFVAVRHIFNTDGCTGEMTLLSHEDGHLKFVDSSELSNVMMKKTGWLDSLVTAREAADAMLSNRTEATIAEAKIAEAKQANENVERSKGDYMNAAKRIVVNADTNNGQKIIAHVSLTMGLMALDKIATPPIRHVGSDTGNLYNLAPNTDHPNWKATNRGFYEAVGEAKGLEELAVRVLPILSIEGDPDGHGGVDPEVDLLEFAGVVRELASRGVTHHENQLKRRVNEALNKIQFVADDEPVDGLYLDPPDLGEISGVSIEKENVRLMGAMIVSAMMDEVKAFQTMDHVVQRFQDATLVRFSREAGRKLYNWWRDAPNRMSEMERRTFYAITLGIPGGEPTEFMNRSFNDLNLRFVSCVSDLVRQKELDNVLRASIPLATHQQQCRKAARDLIENLSLHGYGMAFYAAQELSNQVNEIIEILSDEDVRANYGARDMWQVVDQVATLELGGAKSSSRYRTLATCGTIITAWLANHVNEIMSPTGPLIDMNEVRHPQPKPPGQKAITHPNDYDLVNACELWLADSAISDSRVEQLRQPIESPSTTSRPIQMPSMVQDILGDFGTGFGR